MVLCVGILLFLSLAASAALPLPVDFLGKDFPVGARFRQWLDAGVSFALLTLFFALVFHAMSGRRIRWHHVLYGTVERALEEISCETISWWFHSLFTDITHRGFWSGTHSGTSHEDHAP
jgi:uncharacterized BrkB/YihY/UPF0761 family membrane protein